ncbi:tryptophan halogenase family protein [Thalassotalea sp. PLHSN55]|uniref:tryptophan halogenase family protein n=1 Tax=Thalassotalea sp. PLHSN55 TaxID=3435888 RepID=UPI003F83D608
MNNAVKKVVVLGGGTAGWMSAALIKKLVGASIEVELVESDDIGTIGVGEATIPPIQNFNHVLGLNEAEFLKATKATIKLGIEFENWKNVGEKYFHSFGAAGKSTPFCHFHHYLKRAQTLGLTDNLWDYDLNHLSAQQGIFAKIKTKDPIIEIPYAYHFDAGLYAQFLRQFSEKLGVKRTEGMVDNVLQCQQSGNITALQLKSGQQISGDLFIDCSGFKGLLIQQTLHTGYEDWSHWLRCDRAVAVPSERFEHTLPYTRSIAHAGGWQWRIPLQHRNGNGLVYNSSCYSDEQATDLLMSNIESKPLADPKVIGFKTGRRRQQWHKNVIAIGLSSGFLEPLESTSIHLIQSAVVRLIHMFPHQGINETEIAEYNKQSELEYQQVRDFIILHYHVNQRTDSLFWQDMQTMDIPASLQHKIELFKQSGKIFREQNDLFNEGSWLQVMLGQGLEPQDYHPMANNMSAEQLLEMMKKLKAIKNEPLSQLPSHDQFLKHITGN